MIEEEDKFLKENPIVFKKYKVKKKLGEGAFGEVYLGQAIENNAYDSYGRQKLNNVGEGEGYYITNGYAVPITWEKSSRNSQTVYKY